MPRTPPPRRTQAARREATCGRLLDATIACLAELGYAGTSVAAICERAGVSQGALFRHYPTRRDVIVAAADAIGQRHLAAFAAAEIDPRREGFRPFVALIRGICRTATHAAWREIMVAARTDGELRAAAAAGLGRFETAIVQLCARTLGLAGPQAEAAAVVLLSMMHMFDSEAVTVVVRGNEAIEAARLEWAAQMLARELPSARIRAEAQRARHRVGADRAVVARQHAVRRR